MVQKGKCLHFSLKETISRLCQRNKITPYNKENPSMWMGQGYFNHPNKGLNLCTNLFNENLALTKCTWSKIFNNAKIVLMGQVFFAHFSMRSYFFQLKNGPSIQIKHSENNFYLATWNWLYIFIWSNKTKFGPTRLVPLLNVVTHILSV